MGRNVDELDLLIVEDEAELASALSCAASTWLLCPTGSKSVIRVATITTAAGVTEALALLARKPNFMLMDVRLRDGSGLNVARAAMQNLPVPVVLAMSGEASASEAFTLAQLGVRGYLTKPFHLDEMKRLIETLLSAPPSLEPAACGQVGVRPIHAVQDRVKRAMLLEALSRTHGNYVHTAALLGLTRPAVQQMVRRYELAAIAGALRQEREHEG